MSNEATPEMVSVSELVSELFGDCTGSTDPNHRSVSRLLKLNELEPLKISGRVRMFPKSEALEIVRSHLPPSRISPVKPLSEDSLGEEPRPVALGVRSLDETIIESIELHERNSELEAENAALKSRLREHMVGRIDDSIEAHREAAAQLERLRDDISLL